MGGGKDSLTYMFSVDEKPFGGNDLLEFSN